MQSPKLSPKLSPKQHDLESGVSGARTSCLPPLPFLRRKKVYLTVLLLPLILISLIYYDIVPSPFNVSFSRDLSFSASSSLPELDAALPQINALTGQLPGQKLSPTDEQLQQALSEKEKQLEMEQPGKTVDLKMESILLLLQALKQTDNTVDRDWRGVYIDREPLSRGVLNMLGGGSTYKFTDLLSKVGFGGDEPTSGPSSPLNIYRRSRSEWISTMRNLQGLTVFSKSYCPYSKSAKELLDTLKTNYTVYEVDLRPDAHELQPLLAELTGHRTFPTILAKDKLVGGNDDLHALHDKQELEQLLKSVGAL